MKTVLIAAIRLYQLTVSALIGRRCRYLPTCSDYAGEAIERHGPWRGFLLALARILRCHPWGGDGYDPVPMSYEGPVWRRRKGSREGSP
jgi:hypothetical protein